MLDACSLLLEALDGRLCYDRPQHSFSPWYSNVGLGWHADGSLVLFCHYNKGPSSLDRGLLRTNVEPIARQAGLRAHEQVPSRDPRGAAFPCLPAQWRDATRRLVYRCGGSAGLDAV